MSYIDDNQTIFDQLTVDDKNIDPKKSTFWFIIISALLLSVWSIFLAFYLSRINGRILAFFINRYLRWTKDEGYLHIGSFSISLLSGKIMIRDFLFVNSDFSFRISDGWIIFSYWKFINSSKADFKSDTSRLHLSLNGVRIHWFNRTYRYKEIAKLFRLEKYFGQDNSAKKIVQLPHDSGSPAAYWDRIWSLVGMVRVDIGSGQMIVGNRLLPYMAVLSFEDLRSRIFLRESATDRALLTVGGETENVKMYFIKHPEYKGKSCKEPPRTMGDGFAVLQSANLEFRYNQDILGFVTDDKQRIDHAKPIWDSQWRFGANTVISFGPWAEEQRALLYGFFFPPDYQTLPVTELPSRGRRRIHLQHEARISVLKETSIDIWFMRGEQLESIHSRCQAGSSVDISVWWITLEEGFSWSLHTSLLRLETTTSLPFTRLFECETVSIDANFHYPKVYNDKQIWTFNFSISKATMWFVWDHKRFFTNLIDEWMGEAPSDVFHFIPYVVNTKINVTESFEVILLLNEFNWVDASDKQTENIEVAIVGEHLNAHFELPFTDFVPETIKVTYTIKGRKDMAIRSRFPVDSATAPIFATISQAANCQNYAVPSNAGSYSKGDEWHEFWRTESVNLVLQHQYHPIMNTIQSDLPFAFLVDNLPKKVARPEQLKPDNLDVLLSVEGAEIKFTGLLIRLFLDLKNNYFGWYDSMTDLERAESEMGGLASAKLRSNFNCYSPAAAPEQFRHMQVDVIVRICNPRIHALLYSPSADPTEFCPILLTDEFVVEVHKTVEASLIQVALGPTCAYFDKKNSSSPAGYLTLSGLQFRGHGMYSTRDVPWDMGICEYAWLMEILVGDLKGNLQFPSNVLALYQILETTLLFAISPDDAMLIPERFKVCPHGQLQSACSLNGREGICEDEEKLKYRLVRVAVDEIDICMQEGNSILQLSSDPIRFSLCNAEQDIFTEHLHLKTNRIQLRQAIKTASSSPHSDEPEKWLETGYIRIDNIGIGLTLPLMPEAAHLDALRREFVRRHDEQTKRLHFLWRDDRRKGCACKGDTAFFAEEDTIGKDLLVVVNSKLFAPSIIPDSKQQPGILQSVVNRNMKILSGLPYYAYKDKSVMTPSSTSRSKRLVHQQFSATDTDSYHSARSAASHDSVGPSTASLGPYEDFLNRLELRRSAVDGPPRQGETPIESWNRQRVWEFKTAEEGINNTQFAASRQFSQQERTEDGKENEERWKKCKNLTIRGRAGESIKIFFTPIGLDSLESFISSLSSHIPKLHPAVLLQLCYSSCSLKGHKQPLLETLFNKEKQVRDLRIDIFAHLPVVDLTLFQCEQPVGATSAVLHSGFPASSANLLTVVFEGAEIMNSDNEQLIVNQMKEKDEEKQASAYQLTTKPISVQCIQLSHSASNDFRVSNSLMRPDLQWELCPLSKKMTDRQPRILFEFKSPRIVVELQRIPRFTKLPVVSPVVDLGTPSNLVLDSSKNTTNSERLTIHNQLKVEIDTVTSIFVMARALELTGKNEFPIYEALQPAIFQWINTVKSFEATCSTLEKTLTRWSDITMMKLLKLALDCTHEKVCVQSGKHRMAAVKRLGQQQCACGSCMLTLTLFKWCAFADNAEKELAAEFEVHEEFAEKKARKTALMALLSHWQPDISRNIKLTSLEEAARFKVQEVTPLNTMRSETRIDMTGIGSTPVNATSSLSNLLHRSKHVSRGAPNNVDEAVPTSADKEDKELIAATPKMDLYTWVLNAHRERKEKREGRKTAHQRGSKYVNPMDIVQKAFFYSIYRFRQLEWTGVEEVAVEKFTAHFEINLHGIDIKMVEQKIINSLSDRQSYVTQHFQNLIQLKQLQVTGKIDWQLENDKRSVTPLYGLLTVEYKGSLDGIKIAVDIGSMCLVKEVAAVIQSALDANLGKQRADSGKDRKRKARQNSVRNATEESSESAQVSSGWEEKVIEIKKDFEKNMQLMKSVRSNKGEILTNIDGEFLLDSVRIETSRTDVYVSFAIHTINLHHRRLPIAKDPETCQSLMLNLSSSSIHDPNLTANTSATDRERDFDQFKLQLNKATLNVMESDSSRQVQNQYIFSAALSQSKAKFNRRFALNGKTNALLEATLGDMKGDMPMSAQILHEVVMKHGPQIEQQLNRLSAQPPPAGSTPLDMILLPVVPVVVSSDQTRSPPSPLSSVASKEGESIRAPGSYLPRQHAQSLPLSSATSAPVTARRPAIATVNFTLEVRNIELALNPLPSLRVKYIMYGATSSGVTGNEANWRASITKHEAEFSVTTRDMENINLPLPSLSCVGQYTIEKEFGHHQKRPSTDKQLHYREGGYLQMMLTLGQVSHTFTTDLLNQILFAEQAFREDFKSLIKRLKSSDNKIKSMLVSEAEPEHSTLVVDKPPLLFSLQVQGTGVPWLQLTASTPTNIAVRFTIDSFDAQLTNKWVVREEGSKKEKILGIAVIQLNAKLGQLVRAAQYAEVNQELQEFATFMTQVRVENKERTSKQNAYSYHISVNRPIILIKSTAIDKAILLWLNYKNTYDFWRSERSRLKNKTSPRGGGNDEAQTETSNTGKIYRQHRSNSLSQAMFSPQPIQDVDINLSLSITNGMYMCMPLFSQDVTEGMPALVMSLQKSDISVHIKKELACEAQFHEFKLNFVDHFDEQALSHNFVESRSDAQTNYFFFPSGSYKLCSKASVVLGEPQWMLSIRSEMRGMVIDLDHRIGKLTKLLVNTFSAFGENEDSDYCDIEDEQSPDPDVEKVEGAGELLSLPMDKRVPWLERKMHEQSKIVSELQAKNAAEKSIEVQTKKLRSYELLRFKEFRRTFVEKLKKREDKPGNVAKRSSGTNNAPLKKTLADITAIELPNRHSPGEETLDALEGGSAAMANGKDKDKGKNETVNMHIDVKISIESGSCTLRTAQKAGGQNEGRSGLTTRPSLRDLRQRQNREQISTTNFSIPSVDLKGYYTSDASHPQMSQNQLAAKLSAEKDAPLMTSAQQIHNQFIAQQKPGPKSQKNPASHIAVNNLQPQHHRSPSRRNSDLQHRNSKRGCFYLFVGLASMPSETVVTPHLADYVEQVLEPLPPSSVFRSGVSFESAPEEEPEQENKVNNIVAMDTTILPLDITLYLNVQSSKILFDGMQQRSTAANCLLQLPRLTLMASTKRSDNSEYPGGVDISGTLSEFSLGIYSPHQDIRTKFALQLTLDHFCFVITRNKNASNELDNKVRFVLTSEVGSALIDFDCRRLSELIQFPKPWYRPAIMRRVFFGDQTAAPQATSRSRNSSNGSYNRPFSELNRSISSQHDTVKKPWMATVLLLMQWKQLRIEAQMGNTMGQTLIEARKGTLSSSAKLSSKTERDVTANFELESARFHAHTGAISGEIELNGMKMSVAHKRHFQDAALKQAIPHNSASLEFKLLSVRIEWMTRKVLVAHCVGPTLRLHDEYRTEETRDANGKMVVTKAVICLHVMGAWEDLQMIIARNTIEDFISIVQKLKTFFEEQLKSSKLVWGFTEDTTLKTMDIMGSLDEADEKADRPATAFWQKVLDEVTNLQYKEYLLKIPVEGNTIVGGNVTLKANQLSIACMHGEMTSNIWGLFHLKEPTIIFKPTAKMIFIPRPEGPSDSDDRGELGVELQHEFTICLGNDEMKNVPNANKDVMGKVLRVQHHRNDMRLNVSVTQHLDYLIGEVLRQNRKQQKEKGASPNRSPHHVLVVFQFPALQALMKSTQVNAIDLDMSELSRMDVHSSFVVDFYDDVGVLTDVSTQVLFLPELLKSYFRVNDIPTSAELEKGTHKADQRLYICDQWQVAPRIKCIERSAFTWNPPLVDDILRKLQIFDYRTTIPKALQRTILDPLDATVANVIFALLRLVTQAAKQGDRRRRRKTYHEAL